MASVTATMMWLSTLGRMWRVMMRKSPEPTAMRGAHIFDAGQRQRLASAPRGCSWAQPSTDMTPMTKARKTLDGAVTGISVVSAR